ncbi:MAG: RNA 2'-phosphotransferase [Eubacterium sp.]|nr:RNA 2'-phosphotransferase [Eubacterium sp.]
MDQSRRTYISKKMSYALRHNPGKYGFELARDGSVTVSRFLRAMNAMHHFDPALTEEDIREIMANADKQRFAIENGRIRALYGHSFPMQINHTLTRPPAVLFHGTSHKALPSIMEEGLLPMGRQYVHLSADVETANQVGARRDSHPVILKVDAARAEADGVRFYVGNDKVWLADQIPPKYLAVPGDNQELRR